MIAALIAAAAAGVPTGAVVGFDRASAAPGDVVVVRADGLRTRARVRVYLVRAADARGVRSELDARLHYVGSLAGGRRATSAAVGVPPLATGRYVAWCRDCRPAGALRVTTPAATADSCPATTARSGPPPGLSPAGARWHGNDALWTGIPADGIFTFGRDAVAPDGSVWTKLFWYAGGIDGVFRLAGRRLDAQSPAMRVLQINRGSQSGFRGSGTWATPVEFPSPGCWRLRARVLDGERRTAVDLLLVAKVVLR